MPSIDTSWKVRFRRLSQCFLLFCCLVAVGCGGSERTLKIFVASSMTEFVQILLPDLTARFPGYEVRLNIAGSGTLVNQVLEGADADVVVLAGSKHMEQLQAESTFLTPRPIARNRLTVIASSELRQEVKSISDLQAKGLQGAICTRGAPCGALALAFAEVSGFDLSDATREPNVKAVLSKVLRGEADYGFVYRSDALQAGSKVITLEPVGLDTFVTSYSIALARSDEISLSFLEVITGAKAKVVLEELGFLSS